MAKKSSPPRIAPLRKLVAEQADVSELSPPPPPQTHGRVRTRGPGETEGNHATVRLLDLYRKLSVQERPALLGRFLARLSADIQTDLLAQLVARLSAESLQDLEEDLQQQLGDDSM